VIGKLTMRPPGVEQTATGAGTPHYETARAGDYSRHSAVPAPRFISEQKSNGAWQTRPPSLGRCPVETL